MLADGPPRSEMYPLKSGIFCDLPCFGQDGFLAAGCDEFALVGGYCAERASAEASAVHVYGMAYHFICRNWLAFVAWMGRRVYGRSNDASISCVVMGGSIGFTFTAVLP